MLWTFDQWMHLLAVLAWPAVALIAGVSWVHGCRLVAEVWFDAQRDRTRMIGRRLGGFDGTLTAAIEAWEAARPGASSVEMTCERALLAVLAARGGFPARQNEAPGRSLVREVREMYQELKQPTPRPEPVAGNQAPGMTDLTVTPESLDEYLGMDGGLDGPVDDLYAGMVAVDEDTSMDVETGDLE